MSEPKSKFELIGIDTRGLGNDLSKGLAILILNRVCAEATADEAEAWIRSHHPAGTSGNWHLAEEEHRKPVPCADDPKRTHYMFVC